MKHLRTKIAALGGVAVLALAGCGGTDDTSTTAQASATTQQQPGGQPPQGGGGPGGDMAATLADALGVEQADVEAALSDLQPADPSSATAGEPPQQGDMAAALADALGLTEDEVATALQDAMPAPPDGQQPPAAADATTS